MSDQKPDWQDDWREEQESHLQMRADHGATPDQARRAFGNRLQLAEEIRALHIPIWFDQFQQDVRYGWRSMWRSPAFTITALLALALGTGASTAIFSVVDRILFRELPYSEPDRLVAVGMKAPLEASEFLLSKDYFDWRKRQQAFAAFTAMRGPMDCDLTVENPARMRCAYASANFLATLGVSPILGRDLDAADDEAGSPPVGLISHALWRSRFGEKTDVIGQTVELNREPLKIVGVLPANFELPGLQAFDFLRAMRLRNFSLGTSEEARLPNIFLRGYGRLRPGESAQQANSSMRGLFEDALTRVPPQFRSEVTMRVDSLAERQRRDSHLIAWLLLGSVLIVLLIACTNVANLLLARASTREREFSIRVSIGASRLRLLRQTITESFLLSSIGTFAGVGLAAVLLRVFAVLAPEGLPRIVEASLDWRVLSAAIVISLSCTILFGLAPLARARISWFRPALVSLQIALSTLLLTGASIFTHNLVRLAATPLGIEPSRILTAEVRLHLQRYPTSTQQLAFFTTLEERVATIPGLESVVLADSIPPEGRMSTNIFSQMQVEGRPRDARSQTGGMVVHRFVTPGYFEMLRIPILEGRSFTPEDRREATPPVILSKNLSNRLFPNGGAVGQRIRAFEGPYKLIVGVAADARNAGLSGKDDPEYYEAQGRQESAGGGFAYLLVKASGQPAAVSNAIREQLRTLDPRLPVEIKTLEAKVSLLTSRQKFQSALLSGFALAGLILAAVGLHGVLSFVVSKRTSEIGLRMALGATTRDIHKLVLGQAMRWIVVGLGVGLLASYPAYRYARALLFNVDARDPLAILAALIVLLLVAMLVAWLPSRRAVRIEPLTALRHD